MTAKARKHARSGSPMTTWTMDQVYSVKRLRAEVTVDTGLILRHGDEILREAALEMAKHLQHLAHPLGVDLALEPTHYAVEWEYPEDRPWHAVGRMCWGPQTHTVEIRGGHHDGQRYELPKVGDRIRLLRPVAISTASMLDETPMTDLTEIADTYELVGWREDEAVWVYGTRP